VSHFYNKGVLIMVTVKQGKQLASLFNSYQVAHDMATKAVQKGNREGYRLWADSADIVSLVLSNHFNIYLPNNQESLNEQIFLYGAEKTQWRIENRYQDVIDYCNKA